MLEDRHGGLHAQHRSMKSNSLAICMKEIQSKAGMDIIHPSIHPSSVHIICTPLNPLQGRGGAGAYPSWLRAKAGDTLDRSPVYRRAHGHNHFNNTNFDYTVAVQIAVDTEQLWRRWKQSLMQNAVNKDGRARVSYLDCRQHCLSHFRSLTYIVVSMSWRWSFTYNLIYQIVGSFIFNPLRSHIFTTLHLWRLKMKIKEGVIAAPY